MGTKAHHTFEAPEQLHAWLQVNHASETELWVRIFKKGTGLPSVTWNDCVVATICWGWIDGVRNALDETSFLQRLTPRRPGFLRHPQTPKPVRHLLSVAQRQAARVTAEAYGGAAGQVGA